MTALETTALKDALAEAKKAVHEGRHADAQRVIDDAQSLPDENGDLVEAQALIFQSSGKWGQACDLWKQLLHLRPDSKDPYINIAESLLKLERLDEATQYYYEITRRWPDDIRGWIGRARIAARQENSLEALELWQKIMLSFATSAEGFVGYSRVLLSLGCVDDAAETLSQAVIKFPKDPSVMTEYLNALIVSRRFDQAEKHLRQLQEDSPNSRQVLRSQARLAQNQQDNQQALVYWKSACSRFPDDIWMWNGYCKALLQNNQIEEAIAICQSQMATKSDITPRITLLRLLQLSLRWEEAFSLVQEMREKYPEHLDGRLAIIGSMLNYASESSIVSAVQELQELALLKPQNIQIRALLAKGLVAARRDKDALACIDLLPPIAKGEQFDGLRAWAAYTRGDVREAKLTWARTARGSYFAALEAPINKWKRLDSRPIQIDSNEVLLFTMVRDQRQRLPWFLHYYRGLGVNRFFIVDNDSQDGAAAYLLEQPDVHLFWTSDSFSAAQSGMRWINALVEEYGSNNWCVYVDIDEALVFPNVEQLSLRYLVSYMERRGHEALGAFMADMYPERLSDVMELGEADNLLEMCPYYSNSVSFRGNVNCPYFNVLGGKRESLFADRSAYVKTPIIYGPSNVKFIYSSHRISDAIVSDVSAVLLHFKVMGDLPAFSEQQIANGTRFPWVHQRYVRYKRKLSELPVEQSLIDSCSERYISSQRFVELGWLKSPPAFWPELTPSEGGLRIAIKTAVPDEEAACHRWGDTKFAECLKRVLERNGHIVRIDLFPDMYGDHTLDDDVAIVLRGRRPYKPSPQQVNIMWLISHPHDVSSDELEGYDHIFVASSAYAVTLAQRTPSPVEELLQCTDPELFYPEKPLNSTSNQVLFVGNTRGVYREVVRAAIEQGLEIDIYWAFWDKFISGDCYKGSWIPYDKLREYYCRCGVLLNDHWDDMREEGFISNRLFDAAACGALVVSDYVKGIEEVFGAAIVTYAESTQLKDKIESALHSRHETEVQRLELAEKVSKQHSFDKRAERIMVVVRNLLQDRARQNTGNIRSIRH